MAITPNFSWVTPAPTDFVTDLPADFETFADAVDASVWTIKGTADAALPETLIDAAGDLIYGSAADTAARLAIGTAGQVLTVNSGATAPEWASVTAAGKNFSLLNSGGTTLTGSQTITVSGISAQDQLQIVVIGASAGNNSDIELRFNSDSGSNYVRTGTYAVYGSTYSQGNFSTFTSTTGTSIRLGNNSDGAGTISGYLRLEGCNSSGVKPYISHGGSGGGSDKQMYWLGGVYTGTSTISSVSIISNIGNFDAGTIYIYGAS